jgi:hydroxymethylpyrimidine/phosphomethylpyrimidine kinase
MKRALTIAGSDSGGGAGIQADLKTFAAHGVYGLSALTAVTAQNTRGVSGVHVVPAGFVTQQIEAVVADIGCDAVKTGMLATSAIVEAVAAAVEALELPNLVVDPVMIAKGGAEVLSGIAIRTVDDMRRAADAILELGPSAVIVKGGHLAGPVAVDLVVTSAGATRLEAPRLDVRNTHGTGCTFAAAIAARLARNESLDEAARGAKEYVTGAMRHGPDVGGGHQPLGHFWRG